MKVPSTCRISPAAFLLGLVLILLRGALQPAHAALPPWVQATLVSGQVRLEWNSQPGTFYEIQSRTNLSSGGWTTVDGVAAQGLQAEWVEAVAPVGARYYRILMPHGEVSLVEPPERPPAQPCVCGGGPTQPATEPNLYLFSGEFHQAEEDLRIPGRGFDFVWARKYRSRLGPETAQGNGWDFSYNVSARRVGPYLEVRDGNARRDLYTLQPDGTYGADGLFTEGRVVSETLTVRFSDNGRWEFHPFTSPGVGGKLRQSVDRNGNTMRFEYDAPGRLVRVVDTLGRTNSVSYNADGYISAVTDFSGRQVRYYYCQSGDPDGSPGDLKHVISPVVTNTPNGNDFPGGKTNTYTYSKGQPQPALNHNLLTMVNGRGQTVVSNRYNTTTSVTNRNFDTIEIELLSLSLVSINPIYVPQTPDPTNSGASLKVIVNDRVGNVKEYFYDATNRLVLRREFTGRADPAQPTTETLNRPVSPLRPGDPPFFDSSYLWNLDSLPVRIVYPNGNSVSNVYEGDLDVSAPPRTRGSLRERHRLPGPLGGDQPILVELFEYDTSLGGCCGFNFVVKHTDPRGNITRHAYDERGNRTNTTHAVPGVVEAWEYNMFGQMTAHILPDNGSGHRRRDAFTYYTSGPQTGYRESQIVDATGFALRTTYEYDLVGNRVRIIDPDGHDSLFAYNALNQVVRLQSPAVNTPGGPVRYERLFSFDADNNRVREDVQNIDDHGLLQPNTHFTTTYEYDELNQLTRVVREVNDTRSVTNEFTYDANQNRALIRFGEAANGNDPFNTLTMLYDERDLLFQEIRAAGSPDQSTTQYDYDSNGNRAHKLRGLEGGARATLYTYDGYNRRTTVTDAMGNVTVTHYDAAGNVTTNRVEGELMDLPGSAGNVRLSETTYAYDAMSRRIRTDVAFFDTQTQLPIGDGFATTLTIYSDSSQVLAKVDDNNHTNRFLYDTANRLTVTIDPKGNSATNIHDANGNIVSRIEVDKSDLGNPDELFTTTYAYDSLDRLVRATDNLGNTREHAYDSRDNRALTTDARTNQTRYVYDGLNRRMQTLRDMNTNGSFADPGDIITTQSWDDSSRLTGQTDDNTSRTTYAYDALNRRITTSYADCTSDSTRYDVHDNAVSTTDANGTTVTNAYDLLNRVIQKMITPGPGVSPATTQENYAYDGLSRLIRAQDNDSVVTRGSISTSGYDSLHNVLRETQRITVGGGVNRTVVAEYDGEGNQTRLVYPGGRAVVRSYDSLDRTAVVQDDPPGPNPSIATHQYIGPYRVERRDYPKLDPTQTTRLDCQYDSVRRMVGIQHLRDPAGVPALIEERMFAWDPEHNKISVQRIFPAPPESRQYTYDAVNRLVESQTSSGGPPPPPIIYELDGAGNRLNVTGGDFPGPYVRDGALCEPGDFQMNQYSTTPFHPQRLHDANGNLVSIPGRAAFSYDYRNRLVQFTDLAFVQTTTYRYDCLNRRIEKNVNGSITRFYYDGRQEIEEQNATNATVATYVLSTGRPTLLQMARAGQTYFYHEDDLGSIMRVTDAAGNVVEGYSYGDFGKPSFFDSLGNPIAGSAIGNPFLFAGLRYDTELAWYPFHGRHLDPLTGYATTRNPSGLWAENPFGNAYAIENVNPNSTLLTPEGSVWLTVPAGGWMLCAGDDEGCKDPCGDAKKKGLDDGDIGGVVCCKGKIYSCVWVSGGATGAKNAAAKKIIDACTKAHEDDHHDDIDCPKDAELSRPPFKKGKDPDKEEASAYKKEKECLDAKKGDCGKDEACQKEVKAEADLVQKRFEQHSKAAEGK